MILTLNIIEKSKPGDEVRNLFDRKTYAGGNGGDSDGEINIKPSSP